MSRASRKHRCEENGDAALTRREKEIIRRSLENIASGVMEEVMGHLQRESATFCPAAGVVEQVYAQHVLPKEALAKNKETIVKLIMKIKEINQQLGGLNHKMKGMFIIALISAISAGKSRRGWALNKAIGCKSEEERQMERLEEDKSRYEIELKREQRLVENAQPKSLVAVYNEFPSHLVHVPPWYSDCVMEPLKKSVTLGARLIEGAVGLPDGSTEELCEQIMEEKGKEMMDRPIFSKPSLRRVRKAVKEYQEQRNVVSWEAEFAPAEMYTRLAGRSPLKYPFHRVEGGMNTRVRSAIKRRKLSSDMEDVIVREKELVEKQQKVESGPLTRQGLKIGEEVMECRKQNEGRKNRLQKGQKLLDLEAPLDNVDRLATPTPPGSPPSTPQGGGEAVEKALLSVSPWLRGMDRVLEGVYEEPAAEMGSEEESEEEEGKMPEFNQARAYLFLEEKATSAIAQRHEKRRAKEKQEEERERQKAVWAVALREKMATLESELEQGTEEERKVIAEELALLKKKKFRMQRKKKTVPPGTLQQDRTQRPSQPSEPWLADYAADTESGAQFVISENAKVWAPYGNVEGLWPGIVTKFCVVQSDVWASIQFDDGDFAENVGLDTVRPQAKRGERVLVDMHPEMMMEEAEGFTEEAEKRYRFGVVEGIDGTDLEYEIVFEDKVHVKPENVYPVFRKGHIVLGNFSKDGETWELCRIVVEIDHASFRVKYHDGMLQYCALRDLRWPSSKHFDIFQLDGEKHRKDKHHRRRK